MESFISALNQTINVVNSLRITFMTLEEAIKNNDVATLKQLIQKEDNVNKVLESGDTLLHEAAKYDAAPCIKILVEAGANINRYNKEQDTPLHVAILYDNPACATALIKSGVNVNQLNRNQEFPLFLAAKMKHHECIIALLDSKDCQKNIDKKYVEKNFTALMMAASNGDFHSIDALINAGANVNLQATTGYTPLHYIMIHHYSDIRSGLPMNWEMIIEESVKCITALIKAGANVNIQATDGNTPLHLALMDENDTQEGKRLLSSYIYPLINGGADIYIQSKYGYSPFGSLSKKYFQAFFGFCLDSSIRANHRSRLILLEEKRERSSVDKEKEAELITNKDIKAWKQIIDKENKQRETLVYKSDIQGLEEFHKNRLSIRAKEIAFINAAESGNIELVKLFLDNGVYVRASDYIHIDHRGNCEDSNYTALSLARKRGHQEIVNLLTVAYNHM